MKKERYRTALCRCSLGGISDARAGDRAARRLAGDLAMYTPLVCFTPDAPSGTGVTCLAVTIADDRMTIALPR